MILNRKINTGHDSKMTMVTLIAKKKGIFNGKEISNGDIIECEKSRARLYLVKDKKMFDIKID